MSQKFRAEVSVNHLLDVTNFIVLVLSCVINEYNHPKKIQGFSPFHTVSSLILVLFSALNAVHNPHCTMRTDVHTALLYIKRMMHTTVHTAHNPQRCTYSTRSLLQYIQRTIATDVQLLYLLSSTMYPPDISTS